MARTNITVKGLRTPFTKGITAQVKAKLDDHDAALDRLDGPQTTGSVKGSPVEMFTFDIADAASADYDIIVDHAIEVIDAVAQKRSADAGAANTITIKNAGNAISNAMVGNITDTTLVRAGTINDANSAIAAAGTLRCSIAKAGGNAAYFVTVTAIRR